jgi:peptide/nickel transport system permease protein
MWQQETLVVSFILRRVLLVIPILIGVSLVIFITLKLVPGDPVTVMLGTFASEEARTELRARLGLDRPIYVQYFVWFSNVLRGDFGRSIFKSQPVFPLVVNAFLNTAIVASMSFVLFVVAGLAAGILAATSRFSYLDRIITTVALFGTSMPAFWLGLVMIMIFALYLNIFPAGGMRNLFVDNGTLDVLHHAILPAVVAAAVPSGILARMVRSSMLEILGQDFVRTLRAKGVPDRDIVRRHVLRNALPPILSIIGLQTGYLLGGELFSEVVFAWPGIGLFIYDSILKRDIPVIQGAVLVVSFFFVMINLLVDILYGFADPRISRT